MLGGVGALVFFVVAPSPVYVLLGLLLAVSAVAGGIGYPLAQRAEQRRRSSEDRRRYFERLNRTRQQLGAAVVDQWRDSTRRHPQAAALLGEALLGRCWLRRPGDADHLVVSVGRGRMPLLASVQVPFDEDDDAGMDRVCLEALGNLVRQSRWVERAPLEVALGVTGVLVVRGDPDAARSLGRALVAQLCAHHSPDDLRLAVVAPNGMEPWQWCKWLPHLTWPVQGGTEQAASTIPGVGALDAELERRRATGADAIRQPFEVVVVLDEVDSELPSHFAELANRLAPGVHLVVLGRTGAAVQPYAGAADVRLDTGHSGGVEVRLPGGPTLSGTADRMSEAEAEALARLLSPLQSGSALAERRLRGVAGLSDLLGLDVTAFDPGTFWRGHERRPLLAVPLGLDPEGEPVVLDLKESALGGMGPHGLVVGATGSGKSELLRTFATCLALTHPPDLLSFVLVDFKGGATFAGMEDLPHVAGSVTNLAEDPTLVDRVEAALAGEQRRRQRLLRDAGNLPSISAYRQRGAEAEHGPLPYLVVVIDEFSELLAARPALIDLLVSIGRLGRSLGMHLVLATQRLEEGRLRGLDSHLSYRIALRTFSAMESRTVLGNSDAYELPPEPGSGYLKVDTTVYRRFRAGLVSLPVVTAGPRANPAGSRHPRTFSVGDRYATVRSGAGDEAAGADSHRTVLDLVVDRLVGAAPRAHQVWLPPLPTVVDLGRYRTQSPGGLCVAVGELDLPAEQRQEPFLLDLAGTGGNVVAVGAPRTGKTVFLRTLALALAASHTPDEVQVYGIDLGGGGLADLEALPHVGGVASRLDPERVRRTVHQLTALLRRREALFASSAIGSVERFRAQRAAGRLPADALGDVVLMIDNYGALRSEFEDLDAAVEALAAGGLAFGIHVVLTAGRWLDLRGRLRDAIGTRLELRLNDPADSESGRRHAEAVRPDTPGRGIIRDGTQFQLALPRLDGGVATEDLREAFLSAATTIAGSWRGSWAPPVRLLPARVELAQLLPTEEGSMRLGVEQENLGPVAWSLVSGDPHLVVLGDVGAGKTETLRTVLAEASRHGRDRLKVVVVDPRRGLLGAIPDDQLLAYAATASAATQAAERLATELERRLPGPDVDPGQLRTRSWWQGPRVLVVVDDYDLLTGPTGSPLAALSSLLPHAPDIGLHLVVARKVAGLSRGMFEPFFQRIRELGPLTLVLSGTPEEGPVAGPVRARPLPPGRGVLVGSRFDTQVVQVAMTDISGLA